VVAIVALALYFALARGYDGLRILTAPSYGLEDVWRSQFVLQLADFSTWARLG
jgi:hypothetical protein